MMNAKEKEYMDYLIHNRTELTNQITRHLDTLILLEKKLEIAVKALKRVIELKQDFDDDPMNKIHFLAYGRLHDIEKLTKQSLKEIDLVGTSAKVEV